MQRLFINDCQSGNAPPSSRPKTRHHRVDNKMSQCLPRVPIPRIQGEINRRTKFHLLHWFPLHAHLRVCDLATANPECMRARYNWLTTSLCDKYFKQAWNEWISDDNKGARRPAIQRFPPASKKWSGGTLLRRDTYVWKKTLPLHLGENGVESLVII